MASDVVTRLGPMTRRAIEAHEAARARWPGVTLKIDDGGGKFWFDEEEADRVVAFFVHHLRHSKGEFDGRPFVPLDWQRELLLRPLFGWRRRSDGYRRFRHVFLEIAKKNGKSALCSGLGLYLLHADYEPGAEIVAAAKDTAQAGIVFEEARAMNAKSPTLSAGSAVFRSSIIVPSTRSNFRVISAEHGSKHGPNLHGLIFDEFHAQSTRKLYDTLSTGVAARRQPVTLLITTAGDDITTVCYEEYERAKRVIAGASDEDQILPLVFEAPRKDDWRLPATWDRANPSLEAMPAVRVTLEQECRAAIAEPRKQAAFQQLHLNQWTSTSEVWIPIEWWTDCPPLPADDVLVKAPVVAGLDLSSVEDLTALVLTFKLPATVRKPPEIEVTSTGEDGKTVHRKLSVNFDVAVVPYFWMPEDTLQEREREDHVEYSAWVREGWVRTCPGDMVDYDLIYRQIVDEIAPKWRLKEIGFDKWGASQFTLQLGKAGFRMVEVTQGPRTLSTPSKVLHALTRARRIHHARNDTMTWCVGNCGIKEDENENIRPVKRHRRKRIDGVAAMVTALQRLLTVPDRPSGPPRVRYLD